MEFTCQNFPGLESFGSSDLLLWSGLFDGGEEVQGQNLHSTEPLFFKNYSLPLHPLHFFVWTGELRSRQSKVSLASRTYDLRFSLDC